MKLETNQMENWQVTAVSGSRLMQSFGKSVVRRFQIEKHLSSLKQNFNIMT